MPAAAERHTLQEKVVPPKEVEGGEEGLAGSELIRKKGRGPFGVHGQSGIPATARPAVLEKKVGPTRRKVVAYH